MKRCRLHHPARPAPVSGAGDQHVAETSRRGAARRATARLTAAWRRAEAALAAGPATVSRRDRRPSLAAPAACRRVRACDHVDFRTPIARVRATAPLRHREGGPESCSDSCRVTSSPQRTPHRPDAAGPAGNRHPPTSPRWAERDAEQLEVLLPRARLDGVDEATRRLPGRLPSMAEELEASCAWWRRTLTPQQGGAIIYSLSRSRHRRRAALSEHRSRARPRRRRLEARPLRADHAAPRRSSRAPTAAAAHPVTDHCRIREPAHPILLVDGLSASCRARWRQRSASAGSAAARSARSSMSRTPMATPS